MFAFSARAETRNRMSLCSVSVKNKHIKQLKHFAVLCMSASDHEIAASINCVVTNNQGEFTNVNLQIEMVRCMYCR